MLLFNESESEMKHENLVEKCDCCNGKFSYVYIPHISEKHKRALSLELVCTLKYLKAKGSCLLVCVDDMIVGIKYDYAGNKEAKHADEFCEHIFNTADEYFQSLVNECNIEHHELAA